MKEFKQENAVIRIHGSVNEENVKAAATTFLKKAERKAKKDGKEKGTLLGQAVQHEHSDLLL